MKKFINSLKELFNIKKYKEEIEEQDMQYNELLSEFGKIGDLLEKSKKQLEKEIELKDKYLENCRKLRIQINQLKEELKELKDEIKSSKEFSTTSARTKSRITKR